MNIKNQQQKSVLSAITLAGYAMLAVFSLFFMIGHMSHDGMSMEGCPYMVGEHSVCPMDAFSHITAWENMIRTTLPPFLILVVLAVVYFFLRNETGPSPLIFLRRRPERPWSPYLELFSRGILNPKIP